MRLYLMSATLTATADAAVQSNIIRNGRIKGIQWFARYDLDADAEWFTVELSTVPTHQGETHEALGPIAVIGDRANLVSAAGFAPGSKEGFFPCDYPVQAFQKLYINAVLTGTNNVVATFYVWVQD